MIGTTVGKYRIIDRLGRGGMGIVYRALDETLDREVAIKVLNPDINDAELLKRFRAEAVSLARLNHPGIATIYELHRHGDDLLMVMEFVRGETLQTLSERLGPLEPPQAAHVCIQILDALAHAHRAGIVHRDLKPANVMVTDVGVVKVMDFGIARMLGAEHFTHAGYMMGTPAYMAPEQVLGQEVDGRADLYSVGVLLFRLLTRELPFKADTAIAMAQKQVAEAPTPLRMFRPNVPPWCEAIIARALSKAPADRFQTAEAFRAAILTAVTPAALGEMPTVATPTPAALLRTSDLTLPVTSGSPALTGATTRALSDTSGGAFAGTLGGTGASPGTATPVSSPVERTGTTVVLGRAHLFSLAALLVVLIAGIGALAFVALKRGGAVFPNATPPASGATTGAGGAAEAQPGQPQPPVQSAEAVPPSPQPEATRAESSPASTPSGSTDTSPAPVTAGRMDEGGKKPKPEPKGPGAPSTRGMATTSTPSRSPEPAEPEVAPITFDDVKVLVAQGDGLRDRDAVLRLAGNHLSVLDRSGKTEILALPYTSIVQAFYSRSKQPRWIGADGKPEVARVDLGRMSFFRGERNWLTLMTRTEPVFIRLENADLQTVLTAVQQRAGVSIQRLAAER